MIGRVGVLRFQESIPVITRVLVCFIHVISSTSRTAVPQPQKPQPAFC